LTVATPGQLQLVEDRSPALRPNTVKLRILACGVCGSDLAVWQGHRDDPYFGHEFTGVVTEVGADVKDLKPGMRVTSGLVRSCGICWNCRNGHPNYCRPLGDVLFPGGFADETLVEHSEHFRFLTPLPPEIDDVTGTLHEAVSCVLRIVDRAGLKAGQSVLVLGLGAIGALAAELCRGLGAGMVVGMDLNPYRLSTAERLKIDAVVDRRNEDWLERVRLAVGPQGADVVIEATGSPKALGDAFRAARLGATVVVGSVYHDLAEQLDLLPVMRKELTVVGAKGSYPYLASSEKSLALEAILAGHFSIREYFGVYSPEEAARAFEDVQAGKYIKPVIRFSEQDSRF